MLEPLPPDPYKALNLPEDSQFDVIKKRYRELVLKCHPDKCPEPEKAAATEKFAVVQNAWEILGDTAKRQEYHKLVKQHKLADDLAKQHQSSPAGTRPSAAGAGYYGNSHHSPHAPYGFSPSRSSKTRYEYEYRSPYGSDPYIYDAEPRASPRAFKESRRPRSWEEDRPRERAERSSRESERERTERPSRESERDREREREKASAGRRDTQRDERTRDRPRSHKSRDAEERERKEAKHAEKARLKAEDRERLRREAEVLAAEEKLAAKQAARIAKEEKEREEKRKKEKRKKKEEEAAAAAEKVRQDMERMKLEQEAERRAAKKAAKKQQEMPTPKSKRSHDRTDREKRDFEEQTRRIVLEDDILPSKSPATESMRDKDREGSRSKEDIRSSRSTPKHQGQNPRRTSHVDTGTTPPLSSSYETKSPISTNVMPEKSKGQFHYASNYIRKDVAMPTLSRSHTMRPDQEVYSAADYAPRMPKLQRSATEKVPSSWREADYYDAHGGTSPSRYVDIPGSQFTRAKFGSFNTRDPVISSWSCASPMTAQYDIPVDYAHCEIPETRSRHRDTASYGH